EVLNGSVVGSLIAVEGHTDNVPIRYSGWLSNWELSSARALSVLHFLIDEGGINPERLSANGYGEFHPVVSNDTPEGQQQNRRVEIVILPEQIKKIKAGE
ncbi:flagellar motor protein MotB, partial [Candidatus Omnitrophota bacterium]